MQSFGVNPLLLSLLLSLRSGMDREGERRSFGRRVYAEPQCVAHTFVVAFSDDDIWHRRAPHNSNGNYEKQPVPLKTRIMSNEIS